jgi:hypothetical protein
MQYGFHGDSSLYTKAGARKGSVKGDMMHALGGCSIVFEPIAGGTIPDVTASVLSRARCSTMLISVFGNGLETTRHPGLENHLIPLLQAVRSKSDRAVFFIGGYAAKYGYPPVFDENMDRIRRSLHINGAVVIDGAEQVARWSLAPDLLHFSSENKPEIVQFWYSALQLAKPLPAVECSHVVAWAPTDQPQPPARISHCPHEQANNVPPPPPPPPPILAVVPWTEAQVLGPQQTGQCGEPSLPWVLDGKCFLCKVDGVCCTDEHLSSKKHLYRASVPWDYIDDRALLSPEQVAIVKAMQPASLQSLPPPTPQSPPPPPPPPPLPANATPSDASLSRPPPPPGSSSTASTDDGVDRTWAVPPPPPPAVAPAREWGVVSLPRGAADSIESAMAHHDMLPSTPSALIGTLYSEVEWLSHTSWLQVAASLHVAFRSLRRDGWAVNQHVSGGLIELALCLHDDRVAVARANDELASALSMHRFAPRLAAVQPFKCHECSAVGETTYATRRGQRLREHTFCMRWCGACWSNHMSSWEAPEPTVKPEKPVLAVVVRERKSSTARSSVPSVEACRRFAGDAWATAENGGWVCDMCVMYNYVDKEAPPLQSVCRLACSLCAATAPHLDDNPWRSLC